MMESEGVPQEALLGPVYALIDLYGKVDVVVDVSPDINELVCLFIHLDSCLEVDYCGRTRLAPARKVPSLVSKTAHTLLLCIAG